MGALYISTAFREYAKAQVAYADILLIKHAESALSLCRCGRLHPCDDRQHWLRMRAHFGRFLTDERYSSEVQQPHPTNPTPSDPSRPVDLA
ncbi:hypothetical protein [Salinispora pacifica]|uniref:hypothetical protein n=1 Tax=Salinispora pacifica TaxID=351187 RepID=UPI0004821988|nr:hypothetical protein [Salinispora pacifica]